ncbi:MAG: hypothetical protein HYV26_06890 [Candidatus Hydrogenedentes bacterium]|nr:hypothetical protein [Candidatus Hydrogenedentota bacterium]
MALALLLCTSFALGEAGDEAKDTATAENKAKQLREGILAEAAALTDHPWAGEYRSGDGILTRQSLLLAPEAGYLFEWGGCMGLYYRNYGPVKESNGRIRLSFTLKNKGELGASKGIPEEFVPVVWGDQHYLIPAGDLLGFCNTVNEGLAPEVRGAFYLVRNSDWKKPTAGLPLVPEQFQPYLLATPVTAEITDINAVTTRPTRGGWQYKDTRVTLNAGRKTGLLKGMRMYVVEPEDRYGLFLINTVEESSSQAVMSVHERQDGKVKHPPEKGWQLSTRRVWPKSATQQLPE